MPPLAWTLSRPLTTTGQRWGPVARSGQCRGRIQSRSIKHKRPDMRQCYAFELIGVHTACMVASTVSTFAGVSLHTFASAGIRFHPSINGLILQSNICVVACLGGKSYVHTAWRGAKRAQCCSRTQSCRIQKDRHEMRWVSVAR